MDAKAAKSLENKAHKYMVGEDHHLYRRVGSSMNQRFVKVPFIAERPGIMREVHDGHGHFGIHSTCSILYRNYWWPNVFDDMKSFIQSCHPCQLFSPATHSRSPHQGKTQDVLGIFKQFSIDFVGPLPQSKSGAKYVLVGTEMFTRWPLAVATKKADATTAATFLYEEIFTKFGPLTTILSDNGSHFANQVMEKYVALCNARHKFGTPYHPETQGMVEKLNHTLVSAIKKLTVSNPSDWDTHLNTILYAYRVRAHESIGLSPFELLYGVVPVDAERDPLLAFGKSLGFDRLLALPEIRNEVIIKDARARALAPTVDYCKFLPGTLVLHKNFNRQNKLDTHWIDRVYVVVSAFNNNTYLLADSRTGRLLKRRLNGTHLRKYFARGDDRNLPVAG